MMQIHLDSKIIDRFGKPIRLTEKAEELTLKAAVLHSLDHLEEIKLSGQEKYKRYVLMQKLDQEAPDFKAEEVALMKEVVGQFPWLPYVHGAICDLLDPSH